MPTGKLAKWQIFLSEFDIVYVMQKAIKGQALADHLGENTLEEEYEPFTTYFLDEEVLFAGEDIAKPYPRIRMAVNMNIKVLLVIGDSDLLIHQVQGEWTTKNVKILSYLNCVNEFCKKFTKIEFKRVSRIQNEFVNALATLSSMIQHPDKNYIDPIKIEVQDQHVYYFHVDEKPDDKSW
ncbi:uncharacterized protein LOC142170338 [Nicotiana tabacum]|uniref:Uncharacterized protein LOC142170338 n=1 Tax=Nicotiana tabacum TaxID=4097 RepID=A0AC58STP0_TOBAC